MSREDNSRKRILIVEDEPSIGQLCRTVLTREGYDVEIAPSGRVAQELIESNSYDICMIDIRIPTLSGIELYRWLQKAKPELARNVIFTTGDIMSGETPDFLQQANRPVLAKPFTPSELRAIIRQSFGR